MKILTNKKYNELINFYEGKINSYKKTADVFTEQCKDYELDLQTVADLLAEITPKMRKDTMVEKIAEALNYIHKGKI